MKKKNKQLKTKVKFSFKRMLVYIATYVFCTFSVASIIVLSNNDTYSSNSPSLFEEEEPSTLGLIVNNIMGLKDLTLNLSATVQKDENTLSLNVGGDVVIYEGFSNVDLNLNANLAYNEKTISGNLTYKDGRMYAGDNNTTYSFATSNLTQALGTIMTVAGVGDMSEAMGAFDMSMINTLEDKISEEVYGEGVKLIFAVTDDIKLNIFTDNKYNLKSIHFNDYNYGDYVINADIELTKTNSNVTVNSPENHTDVSPAFNLLNAVINTAQNKNLNFNVEYEDFVLNGNANLDKNVYKLSTNCFGFNAEVYYKNETIYLNTPYLKLKSNTADIYEVILGFAGEINNKNALAAALGTVTQLLNSNVLNNLSLNSINQTNGHILADLNDITLAIDIQNDVLNQIDVLLNNEVVSINLNYENTNFDVPNFEYINVFNLTDLISPIKNIATANGISANLGLNFNDINLNFDLDVQYSPLKAQLAGNVFGADVKINVENNNIYLTFNNSKIKLTANSINELINFINSEINLNTDNNQADVIKVINYLKLFIENDVYNFSFGDVTSSISIAENNLISASVNVNDLNINLNIINTECNISKINDNDFAELEITEANLKEFKNNLLKQDYVFNINLGVSNKIYNVLAKINVSNGLLINLQTEIFGYNVNVILQNNVVYVDVNGLKLKGTVAELPQLINTICNEFGVNISNFDVSELNFNITQLLGIIDLSKLNFTTNNIIFNTSELLNENSIVEIQFKNNSISNINFETSDMFVEIINQPITNENKANELTNKEINAYACDFVDVVSLFTSANKSLSYNGVVLNANVGVNGELIKVNVRLNKNPLEISAKVEYKTHVINVIYNNNTIYLNYSNLKLKFSLSEISEFKDVLFKLLNINENEISFDDVDISENITDTKITDIIKRISSTKNSFGVTLSNNMGLVLYNYNNLISGFNVYCDNIWASASLNYYSKVVTTEIIDGEYVSVYELLNIANNTKDVLFGKFSGTLTVNYDDINANINYIVDNTNGLKVFANTCVLDKEVSVYYENNCLYIAFDDYKIFFEFSDVNELITWVNNTFGLNINLNTNIDFETLSQEEIISLLITAIENLQLTSNSLTVSYENYVVNLNATTYVNNITLSSGENYINLCINNNNPSLPNINFAEYIDWTVTSGIVTNIFDLTKQNLFNLQVEFTYKGETYIADVQLDVKNNTAKLSTNLFGYKVVINYQNNNVYINFGGLKLYDNDGDLVNTVLGLLNKFDIDTSSLGGLSNEFSKINMFDVINSFKLYSIGQGKDRVTLSIEDVLNLKEKLNVTDEILLKLTLWHNDSNVNKIDLTSQLFSASVTLLKANNNFALTDEEINSYTTKVSHVSSYVDRLINTYNSIKTENGYSISGKINVRYSQLKLDGTLNLNVVNDKIYAHIGSTAFGVNTNIYLADKELYLDVAGLKIYVTITEEDINEIISWINSTFDQNIEFKFENQMLDIKTPSLDKVLFDLSENNFGIGLTEYMLGGNLNTFFKDLLLNMAFEEDVLNAINISTNVLDKNTTVYEQGYSEYAYDFENDVTKAKNLVMRLNDLSFGASVNASVWGFNDGKLQTLNQIPTSKFNHYSNVLDIVEYAFNYYKEGDINLSADLDVNEKVGETTRPVAEIQNARIYSTLELDESYNPVSGNFYAGGDIIEYQYGETTKTVKHTVKVNYDNNYLYASYTHNNKVFNGGEDDVNNKSLNIKMQKDSIREILSLVLHVLNIDLGSFGTNLNIPECDLNVENLRNMLGIKENNSGEIISDIDNILSSLDNIIGIINNIDLNVENGVSTLTLSLKLNEEIMNISIVFVNNTLSSISANDIKVNETQTLNFTINQVESEKPAYDTTQEHIDLSNASELLKAFINTSALNDYHIKGQIALSVLDIKAAKLNVDVKVKLVDKKPVIAIELDNYPLIGLVNGENTNGVGATGLIIDQRHRKISIYIKDGFAYLRTVDEKWGAYKEYERATKIETSTLFAQLEYYMQYLLGFTDSVQGAINDAIEKGRNREYPINICNIINSFDFKDGWYNVSINLSELAYSNDIGTMNLQLTTINNSSTNNLDYLYKLGLNVDMLDLIKLETDNASEDILKLVDIGVTQNIDSIYNYMNNFTYASEVEVERKGSDALGVVNSGSANATFVMNNGSNNVTTTGNVGSSITYPASTYQEDTGYSIKYYSLEGWYSDEDLTETFNKTYYSRFGTTAYAKWTLTNERNYYAVSFNSNGGSAVNQTKVFVGEYTILPSLVDKVVNSGNYKYYYSFGGWYANADLTETASSIYTPTRNITLYAKWNLYKTEKYVNVSFVTNGYTSYSTAFVLSTSGIDLNAYVPHKCDNKDTSMFSCSHTSYDFEGWYFDSNFTQKYTGGAIENDCTLYAKYTSRTWSHSVGFWICGQNCH